MPRTIALVAIGFLVSACAGSPGATGASPSVAPAPAVTAPASSPAPTSSPPQVARSSDSPTQGRIDFFLDRVAADPADGDAQLELGLALLQRIRETADPTLYGPAEAALGAARRLLHDDPAPLIGLGGLQLGRHDFADALETGNAALVLAPGSVSAASVVVDALIELGRYDEAFDAVESLAARSPDISSLARLSYARELRGDLPGAIDAMEEAARSPSLAPENTAYVLSILGQLQRLDGDPVAARTSFDDAIGLVPNHAPSLAGLGRLAVGDGDLAMAADRFGAAAVILPLPEYVIALGESLEAAGDMAGAQRQYDLARAEIALFRANGVAVDLELALFEADHGDPAAAVDVARSAYDAAPTVKAADALAWSLHRAGRTDEAQRFVDEALRLGSREPLFLYHAGQIAAATGDTSTARAYLADALALDPGFSATAVELARSTLAGG